MKNLETADELQKFIEKERIRSNHVCQLCGCINTNENPLIVLPRDSNTNNKSILICNICFILYEHRLKDSDLITKRQIFSTWIFRHLIIEKDASIDKNLLEAIYNEDNTGNTYSFNWFLTLLKERYSVVTSMKHGIIIGCKLNDDIEIGSKISPFQIPIFTHTHHYSIHVFNTNPEKENIIVENKCKNKNVGLEE